MAIEKKSLISTLKTTKKANVVSSTPSHEAANFAPKTKMNKTHSKAHSKAYAKAHSKAISKVVAKKMGVQ